MSKLKYLLIPLMIVFSLSSCSREDSKSVDAFIEEHGEDVANDIFNFVFTDFPIPYTSSEATLNDVAVGTEWHSADSDLQFTVHEVTDGFVVLKRTDENNIAILREVPKEEIAGQFVLPAMRIPFVLVWLLFGATFFTFAFKFLSLRGFKLAIDVVRGKYTDPNAKGEVSHFQALTTALSATVGLGNIAGVAVAIGIGGPGATFWMIIGGILGMSSKMAECTLGVKYREIGPDGVVHGGPMYYLKQGLNKLRMGPLGTSLAVLFSIACIFGSFGGGNMFQVNQAYAQFIEVVAPDNTGFFYDFPWIYSGFLSLLVGVVIIGGIRSIARITEKIVPFMTGIYFVTALVIIGANITEVGTCIGLIVNGAFDGSAVAGGVIGVLIAGFQRAAFSNEAGIGSAPIAHSAVKTSEPASEGLVAMLEPFIDTVVVCTITAIVIIISGAHTSSETGIAMTSVAFTSVFPWFQYFLLIAVTLFAYSTMVSWSYYGLQSWKFVFGKSKTADLSYKVLFLAFIVIGGALELKAVITFSDAMIFAMCFPNMLGLLLLHKDVRNEVLSFVRRAKSGEIEAQIQQ